MLPKPHPRRRKLSQLPNFLSHSNDEKLDERGQNEENSREFLFKKYDPSAPDEIDTINDLMLANCKEIIEDINLAVNTINDFIDEISNTKKNNPILDNILSPIFASLLIELSPSLNQIENLK